MRFKASRDKERFVDSQIKIKTCGHSDNVVFRKLEYDKMWKETYEFRRQGGGWGASNKTLERHAEEFKQAKEMYTTWKETGEIALYTTGKIYISGDWCYLLETFFMI
jgi:hypothetical protein